MPCGKYHRRNAWKTCFPSASKKDISPSAREETKWMTAAEVEASLTDRNSPTYSQAQTLLKYDAACGRNLSALAKQRSPFVNDRRAYQGTTQYLITRPAE